MTKHERKLQRRAKRKAKRVSNRIKASGVPSCFHVIEAEGFDSGFEIEAAAEGERKTKRFSMSGSK